MALSHQSNRRLKYLDRLHVIFIQEYIFVFLFLLFRLCSFLERFCSYLWMADLSYFVIILLGFQFLPFFEWRYLFYSRSSDVSFVPNFRSFFPIFKWFVPIFIIILMGNYLLLGYLFYSRSLHVSFVPVFRSFVP